MTGRATDGFHKRETIKFGRAFDHIDIHDTLEFPEGGCNILKRDTIQQYPERDTIYQREVAKSWTISIGGAT